MAKRQPQPAAGRARDRAGPKPPDAQTLQLPPADPPRKHIWFLRLAGLAWLVWMLFLVAMAIR